jgi:ribonuclease E
VERALRDAMKRDRARTKILRTSPFGLVEMTRQRIRTNPKRSAYRECPSCGGAGVVKTAESMAIEVVRSLILVSQRPPISKVVITVAAEVADFLNNRKRHEITRLEQDGKLSVQIVGLEEAPPEHLLIVCRDADDREVKFQ